MIWAYQGGLIQHGVNYYSIKYQYKLLQHGIQGWTVSWNTEVDYCKWDIRVDCCIVVY